MDKINSLNAFKGTNAEVKNRILSAADSKSEKILALESLRGIAAISVAIFHLNLNSHFNNDFTSNAWFMVDFFFVLSGFVISLNYIDRIKSVSSLLEFQKRRFLRLYPLHFVMLLIFLLIEVAKYIASEKYGLAPGKPPFVRNDFFAFIANVFLIQNWTIPYLTYNGPSWSISAEFFTYAMFASIVLLTRGNRIFLCVILISAILTLGYIL